MKESQVKKKDNACNKKDRRKSQKIYTGHIQPIGCNLHPIRLELAQGSTIRSDGARTDRMVEVAVTKLHLMADLIPIIIGG